MDAPNPALTEALNASMRTTGIVLHFKGGGSHGITALANYAELSRRLPVPILSLNPLICADSVGANCASLVAAPSLTDPTQARYDPHEYLKIYADNVVNLLSADLKIAVTSIRRIIGDYSLHEALASLHITSTEVTKDDSKPTYFNSYSAGFKEAYPSMKLLEENQAHLETWKAVMASGSFITHRGLYEIDENGNKKKFTDMAWAELHDHLIDHERNFRRAYPVGTLTKVNLGNNYHHAEMPDTKVGTRWFLRNGLEQGRIALRDRTDNLHSRLFDHMIDLSLVVPRGEKIPSAFSNRPSDINALMEWTQHMIMSPKHQIKLDQAAAHIIAEYGFEPCAIGEPLTWPSPLPIRERPNPVTPIAEMGTAFLRSAHPVAVNATTHAAKWLGSQIHQAWDRSAPAINQALSDAGYFLMNGTHASDARARQARQVEAATRLSQTRLSEPHTPSESGHMPL